MSNRVSNLKEDLLDCLLSDYPEISTQNLLNEILVDYLSLIDDDRLSELEDIIVNQFGEWQWLWNHSNQVLRKILIVFTM